MQELSVFHISQLQGDYTFHKERAIPEDVQILYVTIPWDIDRTYTCWPRELAGWLVPFFGYSTSVETVCDFHVEQWLKEKGMKADWEKLWPYPAYKEYHRQEYAEVLFCKGMGQQKDKQINCYVLGYEDYVPKLLEPYLKRIKTLTFIMAGEQQDHLENYLVQLSEEEGLAANLRLLEDKTGYRRLRPECVAPALVLDFTGEEKVAPAGADSGLIWIDMDSLEGKKHKILVKSRETVYFSMKEEWGRLDTVSKNGYNTLVN